MVSQYDQEAQDPVAYPSHRKRTWTVAQKDKIRQIFNTMATGPPFSTSFLASLSV